MDSTKQSTFAKEDANKEAVGSSGAESGAVDVYTCGLYVRIGMELYITSLSTRDSTRATEEVSVIGAIIGVIQSSLPYLKQILRKATIASIASKQIFVHNAIDSQILWTVAKAFICINASLEDPSHLANIRECDGMSVVSNMVSIFSQQMLQCDTVLLNHHSKNILESVFEIISCMIDHSVRGNFAAGDRESEVQILQTPAFADLVAFIFKSPFHTNEYLWAELLSLLKEGINAEPSYLGTFLRSSYAEPIAQAFSYSTHQDNFLNASPSKIDIVLPHLSRFVASLCITGEGRSGYARMSYLECSLNLLCTLPVSCHTVRGCHQIRVDVVRVLCCILCEMILGICRTRFKAIFVKHLRQCVTRLPPLRRKE